MSLTKPNPRFNNPRQKCLPFHILLYNLNLALRDIRLSGFKIDI